MILDRYIDAAGKIRITWLTESGSYMYKFDEEPSLETLKQLGEANDYQSTLNSIQPLQFNTTEYNPVVNHLIDLMLVHGYNFDLSIYQDFMNSLRWAEQSAVRMFMYDLCTIIHPGNSFDEDQTVIAVKEYITEKTVDELNRLIGFTKI